jgi:NAD(P)H-hydrate epimerase
LRLATSSGQVVVLKGARTVIASPIGELRICRSGTPALGSAGTGDVLGGLIATLMVSLPPFTAAWVGVELHARAGTLAARGDRGLVASEVAQLLGDALEQCRSASQGGNDRFR